MMDVYVCVLLAQQLKHDAFEPKISVEIWSQALSAPVKSSGKEFKNP